MSSLFRRFLMLVAAMSCLAGCATATNSAARRGDQIHVHNISPASLDDAVTLASLAPAAGGGLAVAEIPFAAPAPLPASSLAYGCGRDRRFAGADLFAVELDGGQSRLGLGFDAGIVDDSDPAQIKYQEAMLSFRYRLQPVTSRGFACASPR